MTKTDYSAYLDDAYDAIKGHPHFDELCCLLISQGYDMQEELTDD